MTLYWIQRLGEINNVCNVLLAAAAIFAFFCGLTFSATGWGHTDDAKRYFVKTLKVLAAIIVLASLGCIFIPTPEQAQRLWPQEIK